MTSLSYLFCLNMAAIGNLIPLEDTNPFRRNRSPPPSYSSLSRRRSNSTPVVTSRSASRARVTDMKAVDTNRPRRPASQNNHGRSHHHHHHRRHHHSSRVRPDTIDNLDTVSALRYHHEGPYDAVYPERNRYSHLSPVAAVKETNAEALKATPTYKIIDSLERHRPLDGVSFYPPGTTDEEGHVYDYKEGDNMMTEMEGNFQRDPGMVCRLSVMDILAIFEIYDMLTLSNRSLPRQILRTIPFIRSITSVFLDAWAVYEERLVAWNPKVEITNTPKSTVDMLIHWAGSLWPKSHPQAI